MLKPRTARLALLALLTSIGMGTHAAEECATDGNVRFVCGPENPEDMILLPDTEWLMVSGMTDEGHLHAVNVRTHESVVVFPSATSMSAPAAPTSPDCPGPVAELFQPHGLSVRSGRNSIHTLYAVGHGEREAVEVFNVDASKGTPTVTWVGCVLAPEGMSLNSVTALPAEGFIATNFNTRGGELREWHTGTGWAEVPGSAMRGPNGIVSSPDGRWLYIAGWSDEALIRLSRGQEPVQKAVVSVGFHIDNVRWGTDGSLLVAGQHGAPGASIGGCLNRGECAGIASRVAKIDPETLMVEQLINYPSSENFPFGTVALQVGDEIWFGGIAGGNRIARFAE